MPLAYIKFLGAGGTPEHPIVIPPDSIAPGVPTHPIVIPPQVEHPIVIPPGSIGPGVPAHPIVIPPYVDNTLPGQPPKPDQGLPGQPPKPDQGLPGSQPHPDQGLPGSQPGVDNTLPGIPVVPSQPIYMPPLPKDLQPGEVVVLTYTSEGTAAWTIFDKNSTPHPDNSLPQSGGGARK